MISEEIKKLCNQNFSRIVELRHHFHQYPELDHEEIQTARIVADELKKMGIETAEGVSKTGVVGLIRGKYPGKTVLLRADMDALPIQEDADVPYKSVIPGKMHACGHDGHTASLVGTAMVLNALKDELHGNVKLVFQPAEEYDGGAFEMIQEGVLENPHVDAAFGLHLWGPVPQGKVRIKHGPAMAAPDQFAFKIIGKGGHGSTPHLCVDPIMIAVEAISVMQTIISRKKDPFETAVISFCSINGGHQYNILPDIVEVKGTIRTFEENLRKWIPEQMEEILRSLTKSQGADYEFILDASIPPLINDHKMTDIVRNAAVKIVGEENVFEASKPDMGGEDYAYFAQEVPSSFFFVGISPDPENPVTHHSSYFSWDDECLFTATAVMAQTAVDCLNTL